MRWNLVTKAEAEVQDSYFQYQVDIFGLEAFVPNFIHLSTIHTVAPKPFAAAISAVVVVAAALVATQEV